MASWLAVLLLGSLSSLGLSSLLSTSLSVPGSDSARADAILVNKFHQNIEGTFTVVLPFGTASNAQIAHFEAAIARAARSIPTGTVTEQKALAGILYANVTTTLPLSRAAAKTVVLRRALADDGLTGALVTAP